VLGTIWRCRRLFLPLILLMVVATIVLSGMMSQETYASLSQTLDETNEEVVGGQVGQFGKAAILLVTTALTGGLNQSPTEAQQILSIFIFMVAYLVTVWLLRQYMQGHKVRLRDGLYRACSPFVSVAVVVVFLLIQALPALLAFIGYSAAITTGFLDTPFYALIFWVTAAALTLTSVYLMLGSLFALVVTTTPGRYPLYALEIAGDMIYGRRIRVLLRLIWMALVAALLWAIVVIPIILLDGWLKSFIPWLVSWPIVPVTLLLISSFSVIYVSTYIYLLYRKMIDDGSKVAL
jgi:hypothetical protein